MSSLTDLYIEQIIQVMESKMHLPLCDRSILFARTDRLYIVAVTLVKDPLVFGSMDSFITTPLGTAPIHSLLIKSMEELKTCIKTCIDRGLRPYSLENGIEKEIPFHDGKEIRNN